MPIYDMICLECNNIDEYFLGIMEEHPRCSKCDGKLKKIISNCSFRLIGDGWAFDGYASKKK